VTPTVIPPVVREIRVAADPARAFAVFTGDLGRWWPLATHSVRETEAAGLTMGPGVGGAITEVDEAGEQLLWGTVVAWEPGSRVAFTWHPGGTPLEATDVEVRFVPEGDGTRVVLEHRGWERVGQGPGRRARYDDGWVPVLEDFAARADAA
jgi:hypothetical protein